VLKIIPAKTGSTSLYEWVCGRRRVGGTSAHVDHGACLFSVHYIVCSA